MINKEAITEAINKLLSEMLEKKVIAKQKDIDALVSKGAKDTDPKLINAKHALNEIEIGFQYDKWLHHAANNMAKGATLATHISKGVHSMSQGDSLLFIDTDNRPNHIVGSHNVVSDILDVSGSAAALPIYNFINLPVGGTTIKELVESSDPAFVSALSDDYDTALELLAKFQAFLVKKVETPVTSELNKQLLFPINGDSFDIESVADIQYETVVPLYASVLCHEVRSKVNEINYSEEHKEAKVNRYSSKANELTQTPYKFIRNLASIKLGGSKPANISKVVVMSGGENVLFPNLPPDFKDLKGFWLPKSIQSIFQSKRIDNALKLSVKALAKASFRYDKNPNTHTKNSKKIALNEVIVNIFDIAFILQKNEAGWLKEHSLSINEKFWLDPMRGSLEGEHLYIYKYKDGTWKENVVLSISHYINDSLKKASAANGAEGAEIFNVDFFTDIKDQVNKMIKEFKRNNSEVFYEY